MSDICETINDALKDPETGEWLRSGHMANITTEDLAAVRREIRHLQRIEKAARNVANTLNGGFVKCEKCGSQEDTTETDFAPDLYEALGIKQAC